ncbi:MAG: PQQ-binding-like beta-propeller repeat protein, partial [Acidobacteriota bacterium]
MKSRAISFTLAACAAAALAMGWNVTLQAAAPPASQKIAPQLTFNKTIIEDPPIRLDIDGDGVPDYIFPRVQHKPVQLELAAMPAGYAAASGMAGGLLAGLGFSLVEAHAVHLVFSRAEAFSGKTGKRLWQFAAQGQILYYLWEPKQEVLILGGLDGAVHALNVKTGKPVWTALASRGDIVGMVAGNGVLFAANSDNYLYCIDDKDGKIIWKTTFRSVRMTGRWQYIRLCGNTLVGCNDKNDLIGFDAGTGTRKWKKLLPKQVNLINQDHHRIYAYSGDTLYAVDAATGKFDWMRDVPWSFDPSFKILDGNMYHLENSNGYYGITCLRQSDGKVHWTTKVFTAWAKPKPQFLAYDGFHVASSTVTAWSGKWTACVDRKTGKRLWKKKFHHMVDNVPGQTGDRFIVPTKHTVTALNL